MFCFIYRSLGLPTAKHAGILLIPRPVNRGRGRFDSQAFPKDKRLRIEENRDTKVGAFPYDVFICHASEDKDTIARPLAETLRKNGLTVWYDEFTLKLGDSLRRAIDNGLKSSRYGVVILSPWFFKKNWTQRELDGLVARDDGKQKVILPIWHNVGRHDVLQYSPTLADKLAVRTKEGLDAVVKAILAVVSENRHD
jgi:hypothetical protein